MSGSENGLGRGRTARAAATLVTALVAFALVGCAAPDGAKPTATPTSSAAPSAKQKQKQKQKQEQSPIPSIPSGKGVIAGTTMTSVTTKPGTTVTAEGQVTLPAGEDGDVVISVSWVNAKTSSVYARGVTTLAGMKEGEKRDWKTSADLPKTATDVRPVLGAVVAGE